MDKYAEFLSEVTEEAFFDELEKIALIHTRERWSHPPRYPGEYLRYRRLSSARMPEKGWLKQYKWKKREPVKEVSRKAKKLFGRLVTGAGRAVKRKVPLPL